MMLEISEYKRVVRQVRKQENVGKREFFEGGEEEGESDG